MKKQEIYVEVKKREQAETYRKVLEAMGEPIRRDYFTNTCIEEPNLDYRENGWILGFSGTKQKITFGELIDLLQIKPLFISTDGYNIFEDDLVWIPQTKKEGGYYDEPLQFNTRNTWPKNQTMFVEKKAALEWIESQKPKFPLVNYNKSEIVTEYEIEFNENSSVLINRSGIKFNGNVFNLTQLEVMAIFEKFKFLQNG